MVVLALLLPCLLVPASAAEPYEIVSYHDLVKNIVVTANDVIVTLELPLEKCFFSVYNNVHDTEVIRGDGPTVSYIPKPLEEYTFSIGFKWLSSVDLPDGANFSFKAHISAENLAKTAQFQPRIGLAYTDEARKADTVLYGRRVNAENPLGLKVDETFSSSVVYKNQLLNGALPRKVTPVAALADVSSFYTEKPVTVTLLSCLVTFNLKYKAPVDFDDITTDGGAQDQLLGVLHLAVTKLKLFSVVQRVAFFFMLNLSVF